MAFAFLGAGQPLGFALGLVLGGIPVDSIGWRYGYYVSCAINALIFVGAYFSIPLPRSSLVITASFKENRHWPKGSSPLFLSLAIPSGWL